MTPKYRTSRLVAQPSRVGRTRVLLCLLCASALLLAPGSAFAQTGSQAAEKSQSGLPQPETARIDQLITECRQLMSKGSFDGISEKGEEALALSRKIGDKARQSRSLMYVALGMFHTGRTEEAIEPFKQSAALAAEAGEKRLQATALNSAATMLQQSGDYGEALHFYNQSLALSREQKDLAGEAALLRNVGGLYLETHDYSKAYDALQSSLELSRRVKAPRLEYTALTKLGKLEIERGNFESALQYAEQTFKLESQITELTLKFESREVAARAYFNLGNLEKAAEATAQMLEIGRMQKVPLAEGRALANLAGLQLKLGKPTNSLASASEAFSLLRRSGVNPALEAAVLYTHAQAQRVLGKTDDALSDLRQAIILLEGARLTFLPTEAARAEFVAGNSDVFMGAIDLLLSVGKADEALAVSESYHARAFLDLLVESRADLRSVLPKELLDKEDSILRRISSTQRELWQEGISKERDQELRKELAAGEDALEQFQLEVRHSNPKYASLKHLQPLSAQRIQRELLDSDTALIEYVVGEEKSFAWLVSKDKVSYAVLPSQKELNRLVADYRKAIAEKQSIASLNTQSRQLYQILIQPFASHLSSLRKLIIVPDNALAYLPFETLVAARSTTGKSTSDTRSLLERFAISYAPSASALAAIRARDRPAASKGFMAFGDPVYSDTSDATERSSVRDSELARRSYYAERGYDLRRLPYTRREVMSIGALFPASQRDVFLGAAANEQALKSVPLDQYRYLHLAAHGVADEENPARSGIILSLDGSQNEDGMLQVTEIMRLKLNADMVTLSACRTGLGKVVSGEGVLGLTRAFLYAGTRSVTVSLWNVNDTATADLMKAFYRNLKRGLAKDEALRQAKLELLHGAQLTWHHPYYWASFVLVGASN